MQIDDDTDDATKQLTFAAASWSSSKYIVFCNSNKRSCSYRLLSFARPCSSALSDDADDDGDDGCLENI